MQDCVSVGPVAPMYILSFLLTSAGGLMVCACGRYSVLVRQVLYCIIAILKFFLQFLFAKFGYKEQWQDTTTA